MPSSGALVLFLSRYEVSRTEIIMGAQERRGSVARGLEAVLRAVGGGGAAAAAKVNLPGLTQNSQVDPAD